MAKRKGELEAETKFYDKQPLTKKLQRLLWKKLEQIDPIKLGALLATTYAVHGIVITLDDNTKAKILRWEVTSIFAGPLAATLAETTIFGQSFTDQKKSITSDINYWILSFVVAYILIEHGGEILGILADGGKSIGTMVTALVA
jgi:hypothetical protein